MFAMALMEYIFLKLASALEIGPVLKNPSEFDIVFYPNYIEFMMEKCAEIDEHFGENTQKV